MRRFRKGPLVAALAGAVLMAQGGWIHLKAALAQSLLQRSWAITLADGSHPPPWPWADTWPVGRLRAERLEVDQLVLAHASGRNLAFGPTLVAPSALPGRSGHSVISGHRDTHFRFLAELQRGDLLKLEGEAGDGRFEVFATQIIDLREQRLLLAPDQDLLTLVTCYPFDAVSADTPLRYVVHARRLRPSIPARRQL